eukprot:757162-Hanusia_phi.AAC.1
MADQSPSHIGPGWGPDTDSRQLVTCPAGGPYRTVRRATLALPGWPRRCTAGPPPGITPVTDSGAQPKIQGPN